MDINYSRVMPEANVVLRNIHTKIHENIKFARPSIIKLKRKIMLYFDEKYYRLLDKKY